MTVKRAGMNPLAWRAVVAGGKKKGILMPRMGVCFSLPSREREESWHFFSVVMSFTNDGIRFVDRNFIQRKMRGYL